MLISLVVSLLPATPGLALNRIEAGFSLEEMVRLSGVPDDPGPGDPQARLDWATQVAIPAEWRPLVQVRWILGSAGPGNLALSYVDGRSVLSPRVMQGSAESVLSTVAHEMGHQIAFQAVQPFNGFPPQEFIDRASGEFRDIKEGWADCVARVWTGSTLHTLSESRPCSRSLAHFVATLLAEPATLIDEPAEPAPAPSPSRPVVSPSPSPSPVPSPITHPLMSDYLEPSPTPSPVRQAAPEPLPDRVPDGLFVLIGLVAVLIILAGRVVTRIPNERLVEWASRPRTHARVKRWIGWLREKISRDV